MHELHVFCQKLEELVDIQCTCTPVLFQAPRSSLRISLAVIDQ